MTRAERNLLIQSLNSLLDHVKRISDMVYTLEDLGKIGRANISTYPTQYAIRFAIDSIDVELPGIIAAILTAGEPDSAYTLTD